MTTKRDPDHHPDHDLVRRNFVAEGPNELWVADITFIPTTVGFLYLAVVLDAWFRRIVGWAFSADLKTRIVLDALDMALTAREPDSVIHHSDRGSQYTSVAFGSRCKDAGVRPSTGSVGDAYDNAMCESFFATLERELLDRHRFQTHTQSRMSVFHFIEGFYNPSRRHSARLSLTHRIRKETRQTDQPNLNRKPSTKAGQLPWRSTGSRCQARSPM